MKISIKAAAKVNLLLDLTAVLENGYHSIYTVMQSVGLYDTVTVETTHSDSISLTCSDNSMPVDNKNTAWKAAEFFFEHIGSSVKGVNIHIEKNIPSQAGMAGGSADAAAVIFALDKLFDTNLSEDEMLSIGEKVGADVPFCILGGTRLCLNKGEVMAKLPDLLPCHIVIVKPDQGVSTKEAYSNYDSAQWIRHVVFAAVVLMIYGSAVVVNFRPFDISMFKITMFFASMIGLLWIPLAIYIKQRRKI